MREKQEREKIGSNYPVAHATLGPIWCYFWSCSKGKRVRIVSLLFLKLELGRWASQRTGFDFVWDVFPRSSAPGKGTERSACRFIAPHFPTAHVHHQVCCAEHRWYAACCESTQKIKPPPSTETYFNHEVCYELSCSFQDSLISARLMLQGDVLTAGQWRRPHPARWVLQVDVLAQCDHCQNACNDGSEYKVMKIPVINSFN